MSILRERVWQHCHLKYQKIHVSAGTTADTVYSNQQGARKGYNPQHRGKKAYRPVLCFDETREYLIGKLRRGETLSGEEAAEIIKKLKSHLPGCVKKLLLRGDGEFFSWESIEVCIDEGHDFIIVKRAHPPFDPNTWYQPKNESPSSSTAASINLWDRRCQVDL